MKISIDSSDSLDDALRLVGALYGVTLQVSARTESANGTADGAGHGRGARSHNGRAGGRASRSRRPATGTRRSSRRSSSATDVRQWARDNGLAVNERGRIPSSVITAYNEATGR